MVSRKACPMCKKEFIPTSNNHKYCSRECTLQIHQPKVGKIKKVCPVCKKEFIKASNVQLYCSYECLSKSDRFTSVRKKYREKHYKKINNRICLICNNEFTPSKNSHLTQNFCSDKCYKKSDQWKKIKARSEKKYRESEKSKIRRGKWIKGKTKSDPMFKIIIQTRSRLWNILKYKNIKKPKSTISLIGCSQKFLKDYLEKQFHPHPKTSEPMTWENHSKTGWHIDHIVPLDKAKNQKDIIKLFHYTNLQPLWAEYNVRKSNKF